MTGTQLSLPLGSDFEQVDAPSSSLLDAVDRLVDKGAIVRGDVVISIADVQLIRLNLNLLLAAVETLEQKEKRAVEAIASTGAFALRPSAFATRAPAACTSTASGLPELPGESRKPKAEEPPCANTAASQAAYGVASAASTANPATKPDASISLDPKSAEKGVARLVLTLVEFVRQLLERQAIRRMDGGLLDENTIERMGEALARIEGKVTDMKSAFGLAGEDLDLDLGPLGRLNGPSGA